jgi:hypothetical protein
MSDAYNFRPGGSLRLKGDKDKKWIFQAHKPTEIQSNRPSALPHNRKKKKAHSESERASIRDEVERSNRAAELKNGEGSVRAASSGTSGEARKKTAAEEKYDKIQDERVGQLLKLSWRSMLTLLSSDSDENEPRRRRRWLIKTGSLNTMPLSTDWG